MTERRIINLGGHSVGAHLTELSVDEQNSLAPATHRCVCLTPPGGKPSGTFVYDDQTWRIVKVNDGYEEGPALELSRPQRRGAADTMTDRYRKSRAGKFLELLVSEVN